MSSMPSSPNSEASAGTSEPRGRQRALGKLFIALPFLLPLLILPAVRFGPAGASLSLLASALLANGDFPDALAELSWVLATSPKTELRNGPEAVRMAERACELTGRRDILKLETLAAAYGECGRFAEALATLDSIEGQATGHQKTDPIPVVRAMRESFNSGKPWRADE